MPAPLAVRRGVPVRTDLNGKYDIRTGRTGRWLGGDSARSIPLGDDAQRTVMLFADTWWKFFGSNGRSGAIITSDSLAIQTGPDLTSATVTFHQATTPNLRWFPVSDTHFAWPMDGVVIGDDLYVTSMRVLQSNPLGAEYGWCLHKVPNAKTTAVTSWVSTLLYASGDTGTRPIFSPYVEGDYVYGFTVKRQVGWLWNRWTLANFTGTNTQGAVEFWTGTAWSTLETSAQVIAANPDTAEGSVHRRTDGRWVITDSVGAFPLLNGQVKVSATSDLSSGFAVAATHTNPRHADPGSLPAGYHTYAYKAHPQMPGDGLVVSYVDNAAGAPDLSIYWPKFVRLAV